LLISEIRTIAGDDLWMSTAFEQDAVALHFTWKPEWPEVSKLLPVIERELAPFRARPHWGKLFTMPPERLRSHYRNLAAFQELVWNNDPKGKFRNGFLADNLFA
jgi:xylitol oxidase